MDPPIPLVGGDVHLPEGVTEKGLFLKAAVETLLIQVDDATLSAMVQGGKQEFMRVAGEHWRGHGFNGDDLGKVYKILESESGKRPQLIIPNG